MVENWHDGESIIHSARFPGLSDLVVVLNRNPCTDPCKCCNNAVAPVIQCAGRPIENPEEDRDA